MKRRWLPDGIARDEVAFVAFLSAVFAVLTSIGPLRAFLHARAGGLVWNGARHLSSGDMAVYLSLIAQAKSGAFFLRNLFTTEPTAGIVNVFWSAVGLLARVLALSPLAAYETARVLLIPVLAAAAYWIVAQFFPSKEERAATLFLLLAGSGFGAAYARLAPGGAANGSPDWPTDLWVSESNPFLSMYYSPHFIASLALFILSAFLLYRAFERGRARDAAIAGLLALVLFQFHPYHVVTLYGIGAATLAVRAARARRLDRASFVAFLVYVAVSAPSVVYHALVTYGDPSKGAWFSPSDVTYTPSLPYVLVGLGAFLPLAVVGRLVAKGQREKWDFLATWAVVHGILLYAPFSFQRRLTEGLLFPLALLSANAIFAGARLVASWRGARRGAGVAAGAVLAFLLFMTTAYDVRLSITWQDYSPDLFFMSVATHDAILRLRDLPDEAPVLSSPLDGNRIVGAVQRRVYVGHWQQTRDPARKGAEVARFYGSMSSEERRAFLAEHGIGYVFFGDDEAAYGGRSPGPEDGLAPAFRVPGAEVWKVIPRA